MTTRTQKVHRIGNSAGVLLPKPWLAARGLKPGAKVRLEISDTRIVILPEEPEREVRVDARFAKDVDEFLRKNRKALKRLT